MVSAGGPLKSKHSMGRSFALSAAKEYLCLGSSDASWPRGLHRHSVNLRSVNHNELDSCHYIVLI